MLLASGSALLQGSCSLIQNASSDSSEVHVIDPKVVADLKTKFPVVYISGATGPKAGIVNGLYEAITQREDDGSVLYFKRGDDSVIIEHRMKGGGDRELEGVWQIKPLRFSDTDACTACVTGGCALEACSSRVWSVLEGWVFVDQPHVKMLTRSEAEREVSARAMQHPASVTPRPSAAHRTTLAQALSL